MCYKYLGKTDFEGRDTGIDLVVLTYEGEYLVIQSKSYAEKGRIDKTEVDSFLSTLSRDFNNKRLQTPSLNKRI